VNHAAAAAGPAATAAVAELAQQVGRVARALSGAGLKVRSAVMTGGQGRPTGAGKTFRTQVRTAG